MDSVQTGKQLKQIVVLLIANLVVMIIGVVALAIGLLPKMERAVSTAERAEQRFQSFADEIQPVLTAGAGKAVETIKKMDADRLSETATQKTDSLMDAAAERARRFLDRDRQETPSESE